jgi:hypothetical protein
MAPPYPTAIIPLVPPAASNAMLRRYRLAAQRLAPESAASGPAEAAAAVCGVQAQDPRAAALALRSRVPGLDRADIEEAGLVRTWTVRGTVHLIPSEDRPWLHALCGPRFRRQFEGSIVRRSTLADAEAVLPYALEILAGGPIDRASLLGELAARGNPDLGLAFNVLLPWIASQGLLVGTPDGGYLAATPPPPVAEDDALATMARRYLEGYGPAGAEDLAAWSGLPLRAARRGLEAIGPLEEVGELVALPGTLESQPPPAPTRLLAAFDTAMLGWRRRAPLLRGEHERLLLPGGGMIRPTVLVAGAVAGTWRLAGAGRRRRLEIAWFGRPSGGRALAAEADDLARFLGIDAVQFPQRG